MILPTIELQPGAQAKVSQTTGSQGVPVAAGDLKGSFSAAFGESLRESAGTLHEKAAAPQAGHGPASEVDLDAVARKAADRETASGKPAEVGGSLVDAADGAEAGEGRAGAAADSTSLAADGRLNARLEIRESASYEAKTPGENELIQAQHEDGTVAGKGVNARAAELDRAGSAATISGAESGPDLVSAEKADVSGKGSVPVGVADAAAISANKAWVAQLAGREGAAVVKEAGAAQPKGSPNATGRGVVKAALTVESAKAGLKAGLKSGVKSLAETQNAAFRGGAAEIFKGGAAGTVAASGAATSAAEKTAEPGASDAAAKTAVAVQLAAARTGTDLPGNALRSASDGDRSAGLQEGASRPAAAPVEGTTDASTGRRSEVRETGTAKTKLDDAGAVGATPVAATVQGVDHRAAELSGVAVAASARSHASSSLAMSNAASGRTATAVRSGAAAVTKAPSRAAEDGRGTGRLPVVDDKAASGRDTTLASVKQVDESQGARERGTLQQTRGLTAANGLRQDASVQDASRQDVLRQDVVRQDVVRQEALQSGGPQSDARADSVASGGAALSQESGGTVTASTGVHATGVPVAVTGSASGANVAGVIAGAHPVASGALESAERLGGTKGVTSALSGGTLSSGAASTAGAALGAVNEPHRTLVATPTTLEVGVPNGTEGWLKIRAQVGEQGQVNASLAAGSSAGQEMLHRELPALNAYLHGEQLTVTAAVAERSFTAAGGGVADDAGRAMSADSGLAQGGAAHGGTAHGETSGGQQSGAGQRAASETLEAGDAMRGYNGAAISESGVANSSFGGESGRWLNVRA